LYEARNQPTAFCSACPNAGGVNGLGQEGIGPAGFTFAGQGIWVGAGINTYGPPQPGVPKAGTIRILLTNNHRRNNYFGLTGTYYDKDLTDVVYRYDILWEPRTGINVAGNNIQAAKPKSSTAEWTERARFILAADRPTYIPWLSKQHTFLTAQYVNTWYPDRPSNAVPSIANFIGKVREVNNFFFVSAVNWVLNGQLVTTNAFVWDIDDQVGEMQSTNVYRYSRNILLGVNAIEYLGRSGRYTDPFLFSRSQRINELEFTLTYEI